MKSPSLHARQLGCDVIVLFRNHHDGLIQSVGDALDFDLVIVLAHVRSAAVAGLVKRVLFLGRPGAGRGSVS